MNFYGCIIGSEILNGRRVDKHFEFLQEALAKHNHELFASFIIRDDREFIKKTYECIKSDKDSVMFSFGGIGSTPDDLTRAIAAEVFTKKPLARDKKFEADILERFKEEAYPHRIHMADLPIGSSLLFNPINNMSGFSLEDRFFFTPGFPQMAHPMVSGVIDRLFSSSKKKYRFTLLAKTSENTLVDVMLDIDKDVEFSSLPILDKNGASVEISIACYDKLRAKNNFDKFVEFLKSKNIDFTML
ncbi:MAG: molybdopterin-binding protein [Sulfurimonas sp.]|nr:molybdopterin-binding protein [Sulfurimonadaceae bacterium]